MMMMMMMMIMIMIMNEKNNMLCLENNKPDIYISCPVK